MENSRRCRSPRESRGESGGDYPISEPSACEEKLGQKKKSLSNNFLKIGFSLSVNCNLFFMGLQPGCWLAAYFAVAYDEEIKRIRTKLRPHDSRSKLPAQIEHSALAGVS